MSISQNFLTDTAEFRKVDVKFMHKMPKTLARNHAAFMNYYGNSGGVIFTPLPQPPRELSTNTTTSVMYYALSQVAMGMGRDEGFDE